MLGPLPPPPAAAFQTARPASATIVLRTAPGGRVIARLGRHTEFGSPLVLGVGARRGRWVGLISTAVPNGRLGWTRERALRFATAQVLAIARHHTLPRLAHIRAPTLVITGGADRLVPPVNSEVLARSIPGARLLVVPGAGHCFPLEREEETVRALSEHFLASEARAA